MALGRQLDPKQPDVHRSGQRRSFFRRTLSRHRGRHATPMRQRSGGFSVPPRLEARPAGKAPLDFHLDDEISVSRPTSAPPVKTPASILAGCAEEEVARR